MNLPDITLDFWAILFLVAGAQTCFISILILLLNKEKGKGRFYLSAFLFLFGYLLIFNFCYWTNYLYHFPALLHAISPLNYVFGPLLLLYFDKQRNEAKLQIFWYLHFLPLLLVFLHLSPFYLADGTSELLMISGEMPFPKGFLPRFVGYLYSPFVFGSFMIVYFIWKNRLYLRFRSEDLISDKSPELILIRWRWLLILLSLYPAFVFSYLIYYINNKYINEFRIRETQALLSHPENQDEHIIQIAYQVGFNNKSTFNQAFKKVLGVTPSQYRKRSLRKV
ncbi:MAG: helix-turn-helix domain-containing protein [Bacteroidota bacterium]